MAPGDARLASLSSSASQAALSLRGGAPAVLYSAAVAASPTDPVAIIGASGALGFGLAVRLGRVGVPVVIGSRDQGRAVEAADRARAAVPEGGFTGAEN